MPGPISSRWRDEICRHVKAKPEGFWLSELLPPGFTMNEYRALHAAARAMAGKGQIRRALKRGSTLRTWILPGRKKLPELPPKRFVIARIPLVAKGE